MCTLFVIYELSLQHPLQTYYTFHCSWHVLLFILSLLIHSHGYTYIIQRHHKILGTCLLLRFKGSEVVSKFNIMIPVVHVLAEAYLVLNFWGIQVLYDIYGDLLTLFIWKSLGAVSSKEWETEPVHCYDPASMFLNLFLSGPIPQMFQNIKIDCHCQYYQRHRTVVSSVCTDAGQGMIHPSENLFPFQVE
jgi:hypothetical protein